MYASVKNWSAFVQIMDCRLYGKLQIFSFKNASQNIVCEMVAFLFRGRWVKTDDEVDSWNPLKFLSDNWDLK